MSIYHPIGTVVKLTLDKDMLFMIAGYLTRQGDGRVFDYFAVPFPLGLIKENQYVSFNRECITEVVHVGYRNEGCDKLLDGFDQIAANLKKAAAETPDA